ncbi:MAG: chemotaxis protein [Moritella sp.]|uniref:cache domain-containing protein n=1 Tax=unclassified Moritella TaxID=2637987 RepID=UPI000156825D|nr:MULTISPECIES: cache domain-containing protein [unclassified Moritella]EDM66893.1 chemotaxis sensory transducer [Moritella sp. PE36]MBL1418499.1 cache domain-containing protein [Moritella sp.]PHR86243.1 MAG: chemotaxis protein [Moritella sp.]
MCRRCSIICKIILCVVLSLIALVFIAFGYLSILRGEMLVERKSRLVNIIDKTEAIFQRYDLYYQSGVLSLEQAQKQALQRLSLLDGNYIFVFDDDYTLLASLGSVDDSNPNVKMLQDTNGDFTYQMIHEQAKQLTAGTFVSYCFPLFIGGKTVRKISYSKRFPAWGWTYGAGVYIDDIDSSISHTLISFDELVV